MGRTRSQHTKPDVGVGLILTDEKSAVMIGQGDWNAIQETLFFGRSWS